MRRSISTKLPDSGRSDQRVSAVTWNSTIRETPQLRRRLALRPERGEQRAGHRRVQRRLGERAQQVGGVGRRQVLPAQQPFQQIAGCSSHRRPPAAFETGRSFRNASISRLPSGVSTLSGWNCTPSSGSVRCRTPMISPRSERAVTSSTAGIVLSSAVSGERETAGPENGWAHPLVDGAAIVPSPSEVLPCMSRGAETIFPPKWWTRLWWPRHTPKTGMRWNAPIMGSETPESSGRPGPGEMHRCVGASARASCTVMASPSSRRRRCRHSSRLSGSIRLALAWTTG